MAKTEGRRTRRKFTDEFKAGVIRLVLDEGKTAGAVARELDLTESAVHAWVTRAEADRTKGKSGGLTTAECEKVARLRKENRELELERDVRKEAAAFFAKESSRGLRRARIEPPRCSRRLADVSANAPQ